MGNPKRTSTRDVPEVKPPKRCFLLAIAVKEYEAKEITELANTVDDAEAIIDTLTKEYSYRDEPEYCIRLYNEAATIPKINGALSKISKSITQDDHLLIFFAGHSYRVKNADQGENASGLEGTCLTIYDSPFYETAEEASDNNLQGYYRYSDLIKKLNPLTKKCQNILLILDTCYGGDILASASLKPEGKREEDQRSFRALTSGAAYETVRDGSPGRGSPFRESFIRVLKSHPPNQNSSCRQVFGELGPLLITEQKKTPKYEPLPLSEIGTADFIFFRKSQKSVVDLPDYRVVTRKLFELNFKDQIKGYEPPEHLFNFHLLIGTKNCGHVMLAKRLHTPKYRKPDFISIVSHFSSTEIGRITAGHQDSDLIWNVFSKAQVEQEDPKNERRHTSSRSIKELIHSPEKVIDFLLGTIVEKNLLIFFELNEDFAAKEGTKSIEQRFLTFWKNFNEEVSRPEYVKALDKALNRQIFFFLFDKRGPGVKNRWDEVLQKEKFLDAQHGKFIPFEPISKLKEKDWKDWIRDLPPKLEAPTSKVKSQVIDEYLQPSIQNICKACGFDSFPAINPYKLIFDSHLIEDLTAQ